MQMSDLEMMRIELLKAWKERDAAREIVDAQLRACELSFGAIESALGSLSPEMEQLVRARIEFFHSGRMEDARAKAAAHVDGEMWGGLQ